MKIKLILKHLSLKHLSLVATFGFASSVSGQLVNETFTYTDGNLTDNAAWVAHSGTVGLIQVSSGAITLTDSATEDANISFATATSGELFAAFDFSVADPGSYTGTDFEYFAHFRDDGTDYTSRIDIAAFSASGFRLGIAGSSSTADATWASDLTYGNTYTAVVGFSFTTGISTLWIDPTVLGSTNVTSVADTVADFSSFAFRQSSATPNQSITIDNLLVGTSFSQVVPEPSAYAMLAGMFALASVMLRRRSVK